MGQRDIASVFTLPKAIYGRQKVLSRMTYFVQRFMGTHKSVQAMLAPASNSTPTTTTAGGGTTTDSMSDFSAGHDNNVATTKTSSWQTTAEMKEKAFGSGNARQATTIIGIYGPGGIGKIHCFSCHCSPCFSLLHMAFHSLS